MNTTIRDSSLIDSKLMGIPLQFVEWTSNGQFELNFETVELLQQLDTSVVIVSVAGIYRSGKSYLMNLLAGSKNGFELGSTVQSKTKGLWILCRPHPTLINTTIILIDTEGLDDVDTGDSNRDMQIIVLALLLSSTFIYNTTGRVDNNLIKQLGFVSELTNYIQVQTTPTNDDDRDVDFDLYFPILVVTVRDFVLELEINKKKVSASEYFEHCLKLKDDKKEKKNVTDYNEPRLKIRKYFPTNKRHCFVLPQPVRNFCTDTLRNLPTLPINELNPDFIDKSSKYLKLILDISQHKSFGQLDRVNGRMFVDMAGSYITALLSGEMPCIQSALKLTAQNENKRILEESIEDYHVRIMSLNFPLSLEDLNNAHEAIVSVIAEEYKKKIIFQESKDFQNEFKDKLTTAYTHTVELNEKSSREICEQILENLNAEINAKMSSNGYLAPGGYDLYMTDLKALKEKYKACDGKGVKSEDVLHHFLQQKEGEINNIIAIDKEMTAGKIKEEGEKRLREEMKLRENVILEQLEQAKSNAETLQKTMEESRKAMQNEVDKRLDEQKQYFEQMAKERENTAQALREEIGSLRTALENRPPPEKQFIPIPCSIM